MCEYFSIFIYFGMISGLFICWRVAMTLSSIFPWQTEWWWTCDPKCINGIMENHISSMSSFISNVYLPGMTTIKIRLPKITIYSNVMFKKHTHTHTHKKIIILVMWIPTKTSNIVEYLTCTEDRVFDVPLRQFRARYFTFTLTHYMEYEVSDLP